jgi:tetratricopeptide (TPR) repeat protein
MGIGRVLRRFGEEVVARRAQALALPQREVNDLMRAVANARVFVRTFVEPLRKTMRPLTHNPFTEVTAAINDMNSAAKAVHNLNSGATNITEVQIAAQRAFDSTRAFMDGRNFEKIEVAARNVNDTLGNARSIFGRLWKADETLEQALYLSRRVNDSVSQVTGKMNQAWRASRDTLRYVQEYRQAVASGRNISEATANLAAAVERAEDAASELNMLMRETDQAIKELNKAVDQIHNNYSTVINNTSLAAGVGLAGDPSELPPHPMNEAMKSGVNHAIDGLVALDDAIIKTLDIAGTIVTLGAINNAGTTYAKAENAVIIGTINAGSTSGDKLNKAFQQLEDSTAKDLKSASNYVSTGTWAGMY